MTSSLPSVAILMCTYNAGAFLGEQLRSFEQQTHANWTLWVSDDGSTDTTITDLKNRAAQWDSGKLTVYEGPRRGYVANFLSLLCRPEIKSTYYALSDQDDIWLPEKIASAVRWLDTQPTDRPALYCSRTTLVDEGGAIIGTSPAFNKAPSFNNALVESLAGGNTMVMNEIARNLIVKVGANIQVPSHDWWIYIVISACGGEIFFDQIPHILYRQHGRNLIGSNRSLQSLYRRLLAMLAGKHRPRATQHIAALQKLLPLMTAQNRQTLDIFNGAREAPLPQRLAGFLHARLYRQTLIGNLALWLAITLRRI